MAESIEALKEMLEAEKSARIQAEDKYLQSINFISEIKNTLPGILYIFDIGLNKNTFNSQQVNSFLGYPAEEQLVFDFNATSLIINPEDRAKFESHRHSLKNA